MGSIRFHRLRVAALAQRCRYAAGAGNLAVDAAKQQSRRMTHVLRDGGIALTVNATDAHALPDGRVANGLDTDDL